MCDFSTQLFPNSEEARARKEFNYRSNELTGSFPTQSQPTTNSSDVVIQLKREKTFLPSFAVSHLTRWKIRIKLPPPQPLIHVYKYLTLKHHSTVCLARAAEKAARTRAPLNHRRRKRRFHINLISLKCEIFFNDPSRTRPPNLACKRCEGAEIR